MKEELKIGTTVYYDKYKSIGKGEISKIIEDTYGKTYKLNGNNAEYSIDDIYLDIESVKEKMKREAAKKYADELSEIDEMLAPLREQ